MLLYYKMTIHRKVKRVLDGDTFETYTKVQGTNRIRLAGVNKPELHTAAGMRAKQQLQRKISGKVVTLQPKGRSYNRLVSEVRINRRKVR